MLNANKKLWPRCDINIKYSIKLRACINHARHVWLLNYYILNVKQLVILEPAG